MPFVNKYILNKFNRSYADAGIFPDNQVNNI